MNEIKAKQLIKQTLDEERYEHSIRVANTALELAKIYQAPIEDVIIASLLHDYAKCQSNEELKANIHLYQLPDSLLHYHPELWHGPVAAKIMEHQYAVHNQAILNAIYYHTTACEGMGLIETIVFVADYIEPARKMPGVENVRQLAIYDLEEAARVAIKNTIIYLMQKNAIIHPDSFAAYNMWTIKS